MAELNNIKVSIQEKNEIKKDSPDTLPLNPTAQGFSGAEIRRRLSKSVTGEKGSVLSLLVDKMNITSDLFYKILDESDDNSIIEQLKKKLPKDGSEPMEGNLNLGGNDIDVVKSIWFKEGGFIANLDGNDFTIWLPNDEVFRFDQDGLDMFLKKLTGVAKGVNSKDGANMENIADIESDVNDLETEIGNIKDGMTIVKKAEQDANGNNIANTYETKIDVTNKLATKVDKTTKVIGIDLQDDILLTEFKTALGNATQSVAGLLSAEDKTHLDGLVALLESSDGNNVVDTIGEILEIFNNYPEGADLVTVLNGKVDKVAGKGLSQNDLTDILKANLLSAYGHSQTVNSNPHQTTYQQLLDKPTTIEQSGITNVYNKEYINALKDKNGWESELLGTLSNNGTIGLSVINQYDEIQMYAKDTLGVIDNENIRPSLMQSGDSVYFFDDTQAFIMVDTVFGFYAPVGYTLQVVGIKYTELKASDVTTLQSGISVQDKLDDIDLVVEQKTDKLESRQVGETTIQRNSDGLVIKVTNPTVISTPLYVNGELVSLNETYNDGKSYVTTFNRLSDGTLISINKQEVI